VENSDFAAWLATEAPGTEDGMKSIPDGEDAATGFIALGLVPVDFTRNQAMRSVSLPPLKEKMQAFLLQQKFRIHDVLQISREDGSSGARGVFVEDFHIRLCALHALFGIYWTLKQPVPEMLKAMGQRIPLKYLGYASRKDALARAVGNHATLQHGVTHLSWLDIVQQVIEGSKTNDRFGEELQCLVLTICPEYGRKLTSWHHMNSLCTRVDPQCYDDAERILSEKGIPFALLPQSFYRESFFLQTSTKRERRRGLTALEQVCANRRMLAEATKAWEEQGPALTPTMLGRTVTEGDLKKFAALAQKFCDGMLAQEAETTITVADCLDEFASGAFDGYVHNSRDTSMSAFWPWVLQRKKDKQRGESQSELDAALEAAARVRDAAKELSENAAEERGAVADGADRVAARVDAMAEEKQLHIREAEKNVSNTANG
jgi:hypothetical protein